MLFQHHRGKICLLTKGIKRWKSFGNYDLVSPGEVSLKRRNVPRFILQPPYSVTGIPPPLSLENPEVKDETAILGMKHSCSLAKQILDAVGAQIQVGITTDQLDATAHQLIIEAKAYPSPLNYRGFPKSICTSINNVCCHGIPDNRKLLDGDIINIDITVYSGGYHGDCSKTYTVGDVDDAGQQLISVTELCLEKAISICGPGASFCKIGNVVEETARSYGLTVVPAFLGHGIGSYFHGPPEVYHVRNESPYLMEPGNSFTIEPVISQGGEEVEILEDGWTCVTVDGARTAQCEHTVLITKEGVDVLTL